MAESVKLPVIGQAKKTYVYVGLAATAGIVGYAYYKHRQNAGSSSVASTASTDTSNIDPATGYETGSAQDLAALDAANSGTGALGTGLGSGFGGLSGGYVGPTLDGFQYDPSDGLYDIPITNTGTGTSTTTSVTTDAQWSAEVQQGLTALGYKPYNISQALGSYFAKKPLDSRSANIIQVAVGEFGQPPVGGYTIIPEKPKPKSSAPTVKHAVTTGGYSLQKFASEHKTTTAEVISLTESHHNPQARFASYVAKHTYSAPIPPGITLYYEVKK